MRRRAAAALLILLALFCGGMGVRQYAAERQAGSGYEELQETAGPDAEERPEPEEPDGQSEAAVEVPVDFTSLQEKNPDIYAWITVPGTDVDYPVVQRAGDNAYYLTHTAEGEEASEGAIFTEDYNSKDFEDPNTLIYGHNMKNGTMFRSLHQYRDRTFFDENREILIYMPGQIRTYRIFAAYRYDNRHILQSFDFQNTDGYREYLNSVFAMRGMDSFVDTSMEVTTEDKIITLSTCYAGIANQRYLVQAVLVSIEQ